MGEAMKRILFALLLTGPVYAQDQPAPKKPTAKKTTAAKKTTESPFLTIPKDAVRNPDGTYTYTDQAGKKWSYWNSPFGVMRSEVKPPSSEAMPGATTTDKGDTVRFERMTPFGPMGYERKKSEMTDAERSLFESQHPESQKPESRKTQPQ